MTENFNVDFKENNGQLDIALSGQLTINSIKKITEEIKSHIKNPKSVSVFVNDVDNIDLTFIQLLQSIKNSGKKNGYEVSFSMKLPEDLSALLKNAGFSNYIN
ncbi:STAS domain-containing protein [Natronoflexus pectinivorans]|uniref:STAS domain-containing protein n=1 Tax=Natronoflexus pectinivorans TaxID=682526 RepID=A0A4R2GNN0_9BACT|nr:STAS domain-containing protein [Natronoflexus pectinivorans]TCO10932.1 STAS domain-containing protein [Natronoflexus pectinivorans]